MESNDYGYLRLLGVEMDMKQDQGVTQGMSTPAVRSEVERLRALNAELADVLEDVIAVVGILAGTAPGGPSFVPRELAILNRACDLLWRAKGEP